MSRREDSVDRWSRRLQGLKETPPDLRDVIVGDYRRMFDNGVLHEMTGLLLLALEHPIGLESLGVTLSGHSRRGLYWEGDLIGERTTWSGLLNLAKRCVAASSEGTVRSLMLREWAKMDALYVERHRRERSCQR